MNEREQRDVSDKKSGLERTNRRKRSNQELSFHGYRIERKKRSSVRRFMWRSRKLYSRRRKNTRARRKQSLMLKAVCLMACLVLIVGGFVIWKKYGATKERADLRDYYGMVNAQEIAVVVNHQIMNRNLESVAAGRVIDGIPYLEYSIVRDYLNHRFYWDANENLLLYTLPNGTVSVPVGSTTYTSIKEKKTSDHMYLRAEGKTAYISLVFIQEYTNLTYELYEEAGEIPTRLVVESDWGEHTYTTIKKDTQVRYQGGVKSPILTDVTKGEKVWILDDEDDWMKVGTEDGYIGYVKTNTLKKSQIEVTSREFEEPVYTNLSMDRTVNLAWHNVESEYANDYILETIADTKGLTVISPTWFTLSDVNGNITSIASAEYVSSAHQNNLSVWAVIRDFHGGINTYDETYQVLSYTSRRENLINQLMAEVLRTGIDGINVDFELVSKDAGEHFTQFLRELSVKCRQNGIVLSVDNYVPMSYNEHYDLEEQGEVVDYVIIMGYDEHVDGSYEAGSVASYGYVKDGIEQSLEKVPASKLINAVPFYTRLWTETYKTQAELDAQAGTEAANYEKNVSSIAMGMDAVQELLESSGVTTQWDDEAKQYYAQWSVGDETYKIWVEDATSIEEKLKLMKQYNLAGVAAWRIGWETYSIWDLILQYVN